MLKVISDYLGANGFNGLYNPVNECACDKLDLAPEDCLGCDCRPGYHKRCADGSWGISRTPAQDGSTTTLDGVSVVYMIEDIDKNDTN